MFISINCTNIDQSCNRYNFTLCGASSLNWCILDFFVFFLLNYGNSAQKQVQEVPKCKAERVVSVSSSPAFTFWVKYLYNLHVWFQLSSQSIWLVGLDGRLQHHMLLPHDIKYRRDKKLWHLNVDLGTDRMETAETSWVVIYSDPHLRWEIV